MKRFLFHSAKVVLAITLTGMLVALIGCVRQSGGVWYFHEAKRPVGWPDLTPVDEVQIKQYPAYREAIVQSNAAQSNQGIMFRTLFKHIQQNDISMTAPVDMTYQASSDKLEMKSMAFLYDEPERGPVTDDGNVTVLDVPATKVASIGVRGSYSDERFDAALKQLNTWLASGDEYEAAGAPRYLGYNSPFVPFFWRYGEVQIPVKAHRVDGSE